MMRELWVWLRTTFHLGPDLDSRRAVQRQIREVNQTVTDVREARTALRDERAELPSVGDILVEMKRPQPRNGR